MPSPLLSTTTLSKTAARFQQSILLDEDLASQVSRFKPPGTHLQDSSGQAAQLSTDLMNSIKASAFDAMLVTLS